MGFGWIISLVVAGVMMILIMAIAIPLDRKYVFREKGKINYKKTVIYLRWNVFDTLTAILAGYTVICVQMLNVLITNGGTVKEPIVQFFTNQSQVWTLVTLIYLTTRVTLTLKVIKARWGDEIE